MHEDSSGDARRDGGGEPSGPSGKEAGSPPRGAAGPPRPVRGATFWLGSELRRLRLELGLSQRELTRMIGLSAHSNLGEYERGSRIPPRDIILACEQLFPVEAGYLQGLRRQALRERARALAWQASAPPGR